MTTGHRNKYNHEVVPCCADFEKALCSGTDNEGWEALFIAFEGEWQFGESLPQPKFCPWCGGGIPKPTA